MNYQELSKKTNYARKEIMISDVNDTTFKNPSKPTEKKILFSGDEDIYTLKGIGTIKKSTFVFTNNHSICLEANTMIENISPRPSSTISFNLDHLDLSSFNYLGAYVYVESIGFESFYFHFMTGNNGYYTNHAPIIYPNKWIYVEWDCNHIKRDDINVFSITPFLMGCPPEAKPIIKVYIDSIFALKKENNYDCGWDIQNRIAFCHSGYLVNRKKEAIVSLPNLINEKTFKVINNETSKNYEFPIRNESSNLLNSYQVLDFSDIKVSGTYHIEIHNLIKSQDFIISDTCYYNSILKSLNFLRLLRCGEHIPGVHSKCHTNCRTYHPDGRTVLNNGGWHDAGDVSQFEICTAEIATSLLDCYQKTNDEALNERILEEAMVGLDWLLQTRFKDGYRAMAVNYSIWRDNILDPSNNTINTNPAERGSFENFLSSISLLKGFEAFKNQDPIYATYLFNSGIEDLNFALEEFDNNIFTIRWGEPIISQTCGCGLIALSLGYKYTNNKKYLLKIEEFTRKVISTQEQDKTNPLPGFFYEDIEHNYILHYEHRGHEEYPVLGLIEAFSVLDNKELKNDIIISLNFYKEYIINSIDYSKPYKLLPSGVCNINKVNYNHFTISKASNMDDIKESFRKQIEKGIPLGKDFYLRINPIANTRRGFLATLLSKTKAVSKLSLFLNDPVLKEIAIRQIEWTLGFNPFSTSLMYGEGYNYHNLYVAFSKQMVGALPVGMKTKDDLDLPYWPDYTNAVFKEIWGHTTAKFFEVLSDIIGDK